MKTKHLFFAAAMPLAFAACTSEELEVMAPNAGNSSDARPLVEVKLNFQKGSDGTRVNYNGTGYSWTSKDEIGALLMDEMVSKNRPFGASKAAWDSESWVQHYGLVDYIHTAYPFTYDTKKKEWVAPSKLQEGNYFFVSPYDTYDGERQAIHRIDDQEQVGGSKEAMNKAIAANQYFIGYAQVKGGTDNKEVIKEITMTAALAPIKVTLRNIGTQAKKIKQVVVRGTQLYSALTIDPTDANYGKYNLDNNKLTWGTPVAVNETGDTKATPSFFNYANMIGNKGDVYQGINFTAENAVYNIEPNGGTYKPGDALRALVAPVFETGKEYEKRAVLNFQNAVVIPANNGEINFAVMANSVETVQDLKMDIIMEEGQIAGIDLTTPVTELSKDKPNTALVNIGLTSLKPNMKEELIIQFDNNSVDKANAIYVTDGSILKNFIIWNQENTRTNTVTLMKDITFTKDMYTELIKSKPGNSLAIKNTEDGAKLTIADDVPMDVLALFNQDETTAPVVIKGTRELTAEVAEVCNLNIVNEGELTIADDLTVNAALTNMKTITIDGSVRFAKASVNYGTVTVNGEMNCYGFFTNGGGDDEGEIVIEGKIVNNGVINNLINNDYGTVEVGADTDDNKVTTHMNKDEGVLDITKNFDSEVTDFIDHNMVYSLNTGNTITMARLNGKTDLDKLIINGGKVIGSERKADGTSQNSFNGSVVVTALGGELSGVKDSNGKYSEFACETIDVSGDLAMKDFVLKNVNVLAKTTTVSGTVTTSTITLGSVNDKTFDPVIATLKINKDAKLTVYDIDANKNVEAKYAKVINNGIVTSTQKDVNIQDGTTDWSVNDFTVNQTTHSKDDVIDSYITKTYNVKLVLGEGSNSSKKTNTDKNGNETYEVTMYGTTLRSLYESSLGSAVSGVSGKKTYSWNETKQTFDETVVSTRKDAEVYNVVSLKITTADLDAFVVTNGSDKLTADDFKDDEIKKANMPGKAIEANHYTYLEALSVNELILENTHVEGLSGDHAIAIGKLKLQGTLAGVTVDDNTVRTVMTVDEFDYSGLENGIVVMVGCYIELDKTIQVGTQEGVTFASDVTKDGNGYLIATKNGETTKKIKWHFGNQKWHNFDDKY